jgi:hypothetical protein
MTGAAMAAEARRLLDDPQARAEMRFGLAEVRDRLASNGSAPGRAAAIVQEILEGQIAHVS